MVGDDRAGATGTIGEGQIFVDNTNLSVTQSNFFNSAVRSLCRKVRTASGPMLIFDNVFLIGVPALTSPTMGYAIPDPSVQTYIGYSGYFDGTTINSTYTLPINCLMVERMWERVTGSNDDFRPMSQPAQGLASQYQDVWNRWWEWRNDQINMPGSIQTMDFRMRYQGQLLPIYGSGIDTSQTYIPVNDCQDALAGLIIQQIAIRQGPQVVNPFVAQWAQDQISDFLNEWIKRDQGIDYPISAFGSEVS